MAVSSFFVFTDFAGLIREIHWSDPIHLLHSGVEALPDLLDATGRVLLQEAMHACRKESQIWLDGLRLKELSEPLDLCLLPQEDYILVFGFSAGMCGQEDRNADLGGLLVRLLQVIQKFSGKAVMASSEAAKRQFEQIQMMNNELMNTRRSLQKANAQLGRLNAELNNRLVKDPLTGLISRYQYSSEIQMAIGRHPEQPGLFCFIDVDDFKSVNDRYGHAAGDAYLVEFARRLQTLPLENTLAMRISGDEFGLFLYGRADITGEFQEQVWQTILQSVTGSPITYNDAEIPVSISLGMAVYGIDTQHVFEMFDYADFAMYQAKRAGKNRYCVFSRAEYEAAQPSSEGGF